MKQIFSERVGKLGKIIVKYSQPIDLQTFVNSNPSLTLEDLSLKLSTQLYHIQMREQNLNINQFVSSSIFYSQNDEVEFSSIRKNSEMLWKYAQDR